MMKRLLVLVLITGCNKKADPPPAPTPTPPANDGSATAAATVDAAPAPPPVDAGDSAPLDPSVVIADGAEAPDYEATLCPKVLPKIVECQKDAEFIAALNVDASAKDKKVIASLLREVAKWPENMSCADLAPAYQYGGFIYHWDKFAAFPDALTSCAKLGAAIKAAGGLFGGERGL